MKLISLIVIVCAAIAVAYFWPQTANKDFSKIEEIIHQNSQQLAKNGANFIEAEDKKIALEIASKLHLGECPTSLDEHIKSYALKNLASKNIKQDKASAIVNCIESLGINKDKHYSLMVDLLPFWEKENGMLELFYSKFFKGFKTSDSSVLGLLDNAKLMCMKAGIDYLTKDGYPENFGKSMTNKEYSLFKEYINAYRCAGYSSSL